MLSDELKNKIANVENSLKNELSTIVALKKNTLENKDYLMNTLEDLSNSFNSDDIIEGSHMLPQLFKTLNDALAKANSNLLILKDLENMVNSMFFSISMQNSTNVINIEDLEKQLSLYNLKKMESKNAILNNSTYVNKFIISTKAVVSSLKEENENSKENLIKQFKENRKSSAENVVEEPKANIESEDILYKPYKINENDTLLISEKQEKIFLPYTLKDISEYTASSEKSVEDIIRENFIISIDKFKNPTISRFKEAYNLAKNKSNYSTLKSFNFAVDMMFKYSVNPAIIVACKDVNELKDYLKCLKEQQLDLFKAFKIKYEINPMKV